MKKGFLVFASGLLLVAALVSCDKSKEYTIAVPPAQANFVNRTTATYKITNFDSSIYRLPIGVTNVASNNRVVNFSISSPTGATPGVQYSTNNTVTIPAGKAIDTLRIHGIYSGYVPSTRVDTLIITIIGGDVAPSDYNSSFKLITSL